MPPPALANLLWLGREHPLCQQASIGARMLSCLGRAVWRQLILGKGDKDEQEKGIAGNSILLAQGRPGDLAQSLPPTTQQLQQSFVALFAHSIDEVSKAQMLTVQRDSYLAIVRLRRKVCSTYAEVPLDEGRVGRWPEHGVPHELLACAQHLAETENVNVTQLGPASRQVDVACDAHCVAKPRAGESADDAEWEQVGEEAERAAEPTDAERAQHAFETNTAEAVIAVDHTNDPGLLETFAAFQIKLHAVQEQAARVLAMQPQHEDQRSSSVGEPAAPASVEAACASAAAREQCRTLVLETQELARSSLKLISSAWPTR